jgi:hypothetical protein
MIIKSFRGKLADGAQEKINLSHNDGRTGYRIVKFQIMPENSANNFECTAKIYSVEQTAVDSLVDFADSTLLGAAFSGLISGGYAGSQTIIHDNAYFNQDIFITAQDASASQDTNYYIELEQFELSLNEQTVATLQNIRDIGT